MQNEFSEYRSDNYEYRNNPNEIDYAHPEYYQQPAAPPSRPDPYPAYPDHMAPVPSPYNAEKLNPYRGPQTLEEYTAENDAAQPSGNAEKHPKRKGLAGLLSLLVAAVGWLLKLKGVLFLLKFGFAGFTALFSIAIYALIFGWTFAIGLVAQLFIHEMGHALVMKLKGIPIGGMVFVPLLGAAVTMKRMPSNARDEAEVGIAGPIAGAIAASFCLYMAHVQSSIHTVWAPLAYFGFFINLLNLIPIVPFDGGRVLAAIDRRIWIVGFLALLAFQIWSWLHGNFSLWLLFFVIIAATQLWSRGLAPRTPEEHAYYDVPVGSRIALTVLYFGLAGVLFLGMTLAHAMMPIPTGV